MVTEETRIKNRLNGSKQQVSIKNQYARERCKPSHGLPSGTTRNQVLPEGMSIEYCSGNRRSTMKSLCLERSTATRRVMGGCTEYLSSQRTEKTKHDSCLFGVRDFLACQKITIRDISVLTAFLAFQKITIIRDISVPTKQAKKRHVS